MMDDLDPPNPNEEKPTEKTGLLAKIPQLASIIDRLQLLIERIPLKKIALIVVVIIILAILGIMTVRSYHTKKLRVQAASQIITLSSSMQDIQQYLGLPITPEKTISGTVDATVENAQLTFDVQGNKGKGTLTAVLTNGQLTHLVLQTSDGQQHDVLKDEAAYEAEQAAKAALAAKQAAIENNFNQAVDALRKQDYSAAIAGFQTSLQNNYQVAKSYEYLGFSYSQTNQYQECVISYQKYVALQTDDREAYYQIAYCDLQMYQTTDALVNLDQSCKLGYALACSAAMQIRDQLNQKPIDNAYKPLSPQQSIEQQQQMQQQLQNDKATQQMLNIQGGSTSSGTSNSSAPSMPTAEQGTSAPVNNNTQGVLINDGSSP